MKTKLYAAYGSNLNLQQMGYRCPDAKLKNTGWIEGYELQFKGRPSSAYATIAPKEGSSIPVALWEISPRDERSLDRYEGVPAHYFKQDIPVQTGGGTVDAMVYVMDLKMDFALPSKGYYQTVLEGYLDCGFDEETLNDALMKSVREYFETDIYGLEEEYDMDLFELGEGMTL